MTTPPVPTFQFTPMPRPGSAGAPSFDGTNLTDFLDILSRHGENAGLGLDQIAPLIIAYCTPEVRNVIRYSPELCQDARSWQDAVSELRSLYSAGDVRVTFTFDDLREFCGGTCAGSAFSSLREAEVYLRRFTEISGYLREFGILTAEQVQNYFVAGLPLATRKDVEARLPESNRGTDSPPSVRQVMTIIRQLLDRNSFQQFVADNLLRKPLCSRHSSFNPSIPSSQSHPHSTSKPRSRRCFVCGGTDLHRLHPKYCPRTWELVRNQLAMFNANGRLVSCDGSPLPMTRNHGGVAAHLIARLDRPRHSCNAPSNSKPPQSPIAPRRPPSPILPPTSLASILDVDTLSPSDSSPNPPHSPCPSRACTAPVVVSPPNSPPSASNEIIDSHPSLPSHAVPSSRHISPLSKFKLNPPHVAAAAAIRPLTVEPNVDSNPPHASHPSVVHPRPISSPDRGCESTLPHFLPVENLPSPDVYLPIPLPDSIPPADTSTEDSSPHIALTIFELLFISPPIRDELRNLIDAMDRLNIGYEIPSSPRLRKVFYRILDQIVDSLSSPP